MFGDTITITYPTGGAATFSKINQDGYTAEYYNAAAAYEARLFIRHTKYNDKTRGGIRVDRHNMEITLTTYSTVAGVPDNLRKAYFVIEKDYNGNADAAVDVARGLTAFLSAANGVKLMNWES